MPAAALAGMMEMPSRALEAHADAPATFRAPKLAPVDAVNLQFLEQKAAAVSEEQPGGRIRVATVRALPKAAAVDAWTPVAGGFVSKLRAASDGALGLRVKLELGTVPGAIEARVQGTDNRIESMLIDPSSGNEAWTPWTDGSSQVIELFSPVLPSPDAVRVAAVLHFTDSPLLAKAAAGSCTVPTMCTSGDPTLDAAIAERKKSVVKLNFVEGGSGFLCSGTLINTERYPAAYVLTANHCINNNTSASSLTSIWFYELTGCPTTDPTAAVNPNYVQLGGGMQLVFTNHNVDTTLLLMNRTPPAGAVYSAWNQARLTAGAPIVSVSHPQGDTVRYALGSVDQEFRIEGYPQDMYGVTFSRGIIQGGSSGSGLFTLANGSLQLRGILSGTTVRQAGGMSCTDLTEDALYTRFEIAEPEIDQYIRTAAQAPDDAPNRPQDLFNAPFSDPNGVDMPLNLRTTPLVISGLRIDYPGDVDVFRFRLTQDATVTVGTEGSIDTVGSLLDSNGVNLESNDDVANGNLNFGITRSLTAGTYYVLVGHWDAGGIGSYGLRMSTPAATPAPIPTGPNYTDLWWNANESGWGLNLNHQGDTLFATLFTYDTDGTAMWLVMSSGAKQADGSYSGSLYRNTGPAFNASPWTSVNYTLVGSMRLTFSGSGAAGILSYNVFGSSVTKSITRFVYSTPVSCTFTTASRGSATNYQDLWWNPNESGWGVNVTHQGGILFATLFTYDAAGKGLWLAMTEGRRNSNGSYSGTLYRNTGPAFNAVPFTPITAPNYTVVGTMTFNFTSGNSATLTYTVGGVPVTKTIQRYVFGTSTPLCN